MENASKALIIAGAILISILLISVGILVMNSTGDVTDQVEAQADSMAVQTFNGQFTAYMGNSRSISQVRGLMNAVTASNGSNPSTRQVKLYSGNSGITDLVEAYFEPNKVYDIFIGAYTNGYISSIYVEKK